MKLIRRFLTVYDIDWTYFLVLKENFRNDKQKQSDDPISFLSWIENLWHL